MNEILIVVSMVGIGITSYTLGNFLGYIEGLEKGTEIYRSTK
jgi:hypothetical protein